jgi:phosphoribosylanthranilate isomerase
MWVKVCGVTSLDQALQVQACGVDAIGLNLVPSSKRCITPALAAQLADALDCEVVLLVADMDEIELGERVDQIQPDRVQLHGSESPSFGAWLGTPLLKAHRAKPGVLDDIQRFGQQRFLLDAYVPGELGGTGARVDLVLARQAAALGECVLAGGLRPENVAEIIDAVRPWGVDTASGVESAPGLKDMARVRAFVEAAKGPR